MEKVNMRVRNDKMIVPLEERRLKTTVNLKQLHVDGLNKIAVAKGMTQTAIIDEALSVALSKFNDTTFIDKMFAETNDFLFNRDLQRVTQFIPVEVAKNSHLHK
jgi:Trk K+ transport system NAD-binding subunit